MRIITGIPASFSSAAPLLDSDCAQSATAADASPGELIGEGRSPRESLVLAQHGGRLAEPRSTASAATLRRTTASQAHTIVPMNILGINAYHGDASAALDHRRRSRGRRRGGAFHPPQARHLVPPPLDPLLPRDGGSPTRGHRPLRPVPQPPREPRTPSDPRPEGPRRPAGGDEARLEPPEDPPSQGHAGGGPRRPRVRAPKAKPHFVEHHVAHIALLVLRVAVRTCGRPLDRRVRRHGERDVGRRGGLTTSRSPAR